uniref:Elongation of very long chain fatty acids protein n=1 Tax=Plectus sambesii TaxID=2011161 RepID=A0A914VJ86_9BILA
MSMNKSAEEDFDLTAALEWVREQRLKVLGVAVVYVLFVQLGPRLLGTTKSSSSALRVATVFWNAANGAFSMWMLAQVTPAFLRAASRGWTYSICVVDDYYTGPTGRAAFLFVLSKLWELGDTVLLVIGGRPVRFLHWYHHAIVLLQVWWTYVDGGACVRWATWMNVAVHSAMYPYFAMHALGMRLPRWTARCITTAQIAQFLVGSIVLAFVFREAILLYRPCDTDPVAIAAHLFVYLSFLVLFSHFFYVSYVNKNKSKTI